MATGDAAACAASPPKPTPTARVVRFNVHLVLADAVTKQLRQSPLPTGQLSVNTTDRIVVFTYRRKRAGSFVRTLHAPHKCVVASLSLQIWSRVSKCTVRCRFVDEREKECCLEVLQLMGVRVVDVSPMRFINQEARQAEHVGSSVEQYTADLDTLTSALAHPQQSHGIASCISAYNASDQLGGDIAAISRTFFGGSIFDASHG